MSQSLKRSFQHEFIYLSDHAATSPMNGQVIEAMTTAMQEVFGNASSIHKAGREARKYLDDARELLAKSIGAQAGKLFSQVVAQKLTIWQF